MLRFNGWILLGLAYMKRVAEKKMMTTVKWEVHVEKAFLLPWTEGILKIVDKIEQ